MAFSEPEKNIAQLGLSEGMQVADLGAGSGFYTISAGKRVGRDGRVYAVDIQQDMLGRIGNTAREQGVHNVELVWGDLEKLGGTKLRDSVLDVAIIANILFQLDSKEHIFGEAFRVLRPTGRLLCVEWKESFGGLGPTHDTIVPEFSARKFAESAGFTIERSIEAGDHHYGFIARKPKQ